jgi:hypothetical protein
MARKKKTTIHERAPVIERHVVAPQNNIGTLINSSFQPMTIAYNGEEMMIAPRGQARRVDIRRCGHLPNCLTFVPGKMR